MIITIQNIAKKLEYYLEFEFFSNIFNFSICWSTLKLKFWKQNSYLIALGCLGSNFLFPLKTLPHPPDAIFVPKVNGNGSSKEAESIESINSMKNKQNTCLYFIVNQLFWFVVINHDLWIHHMYEISMLYQLYDFFTFWTTL